MKQRRYNQIVLFIVFSIFIASTIFSLIANARLFCDFCKREITNTKYVWVGDKYFHNEHFFCAECNKSLVDQKFYEEGGNFYCVKCYDEKFVVKCFKCGEPIVGDYIEYDGKLYHKKCYDKYIALRCSLCKKVIEEDYEIDFWGNTYHKYHKNRDPACNSCGRYISESTSEGGYKYDDGRYICGICKKTAVDDLNVAEEIMIFISQKLKYYGIEINPRKIKLELVDKVKLNRLAGDRSKDYAGYTLYEGSKILGLSVAKKFRVFILHGMPLENFQATMAHELMHVWLFSKAPIEMDPALTEGSCNYASFLLLQNDRSQQVAYVLESLEKEPDIFYGEGYRRVSRLVRRLGIEDWLEFLKDNKNFPSGF